MPIIKSGAVSPAAWASPIIVPVKMPGMASGNTWWKITCRRDAPTPSAASRIEGGIEASDARVAMIMVGRVISDKTSPPTSGAERGSWKKLINTASPSNPKTIDGTAARLLILTSMMLVMRFFGASSSRYIAAMTPMGKLSASVTKMVRSEPTKAPRKPAISGSRLSPEVKSTQANCECTRPCAV